MRLSYRGGNFTSLDIEVSPEEVDALVDEEAVPSDEAADWCQALGLPTPQAIPTLPLTGCRSVNRGFERSGLWASPLEPDTVLCGQG